MEDGQLKLRYILVRNIVTYNNLIIQNSTEKAMFSSSQNLQSHRNGQQPPQSHSLDHKKEKKIKKRKNERNYSKTTQPSDELTNLEQLVATNGHQYFRLSTHQISNQFCYTFKTALHIRNIIGKEKNVYNLKNTQTTTLDVQHYLHLLRNAHKNRLSKILLSHQHNKVALQIINMCNEQSPKVMLLDKEESLLLNKRNHVHLQMQNFIRENMTSGQTADLDFLTKEMLTLCKLNSSQEGQIVQNIYSTVKNTADVLHNAHQDQLEVFKNYQDDYISFLMRKNILKGLEETPIDMLNYFNVIQHEQKELEDQPLIMCRSLDDFKTYLKLKKPKVGKVTDEALKTCCSACFSNYYEVCMECGMRMHRLCQPIKNKCQRCKYIRKTIEEKSNIPYCMVCQRPKQQNIAIEFIYQGQKQFYAHSFCLLTTKSWVIKNKGIRYQMPVSQSPSQACKICNKSTTFCLSCKSCSSKMHGLCAFLQGYSLNFSYQYQLLVDCCRDGTDSRRLSLIRKFKMNYQKILYKNNEELFNMIENNG